MRLPIIVDSSEIELQNPVRDEFGVGLALLPSREREGFTAESDHIVDPLLRGGRFDK